MGLYSHTTRAAGTVLTGFGSTSDIFNTDHLNHVTHTAAPFLNSWEPDVATMNRETAPAISGVPSLSSSLSDEIERVRFVLSQIKGFISNGTPATHWYTATGDFSAFVSFPPVAARLEQVVAQPITSGGSDTRVNFDTKVYDTVGTMAVPPFLVAPANGVYIVGATLAFGDGNTQGPQGDFRLRILVNNGPGAIAAENVYSGTTQMPKCISIETLAVLAANDQVQVNVFQSDGTTKTLTSQADARPTLYMALVGRTS